MKKTSNDRWAWALAAGLALLGTFTGCQRNEADIDGESHFLEVCTSSCPGGLSCLCGVCTLPCDGANTCQSLSASASCAAPTSASCGGEAPVVASSCQVGCTSDAACAGLGTGFMCESGRCLRRSTSLSTDAGTPSSIPDAGPLVSVDGSAPPPGTPATANPIDVLVMVDNSATMAERQQALGAAMPGFVTALQTRFGPGLDLHLGVISSDVGAGSTLISGNPACNRPGGDRGEFQVRMGCGLDPTTSRFLVHGQQGSLRNYSGELATVLGCLVELGTGGCGFEHQLQSVRLSLAATTLTNAGFLRANAPLLVLMLTDEDDCSGPPDSPLYTSTSYEGQAASLRCSIEGHLCNGMKPSASSFSTPLANCSANPNPTGLLKVSEVAESIRALKAPGQVRVAVISGMGAEGTSSYAFATNTLNLLEASPVCTTRGGSAAPALRLSAFAAAFQGQVHSICNPDLSGVMTQIVSGL